MSGESIRCPHCAVSTAVVFETLGAQCMRQRDGNEKAWYRVDYGYCQSSECRRLIVRLVRETEGEEATKRYVEPHGRARSDTRHVPAGILSDYKEACAVLELSPAASAALARRCLQGLIHEHFKIREARLHDAIKKVTELSTLPPHLAEGLERIREIGNLAAHPKHNERMGLIVDVGREEAEWTLEILESLFKHCYVEPREYKRRTQRLRERMDRARNQEGGHGQAGMASTTA